MNGVPCCNTQTDQAGLLLISSRATLHISINAVHVFVLCGIRAHNPSSVATIPSWNHHRFMYLPFTLPPSSPPRSQSMYISGIVMQSHSTLTPQDFPRFAICKLGEFTSGALSSGIELHSFKGIYKWSPISVHYGNIYCWWKFHKMRVRRRA